MKRNIMPLNAKPITFVHPAKGPEEPQSGTIALGNKKLMWKSFFSNSRRLISPKDQSQSEPRRL